MSVDFSNPQDPNSYPPGTLPTGLGGDADWFRPWADPDEDWRDPEKLQAQRASDQAAAAALRQPPDAALVAAVSPSPARAPVIRIKGGEVFGRPGVPMMQAGADFAPVPDENDRPMSNFDAAHSIAWTAAGEPRSMLEQPDGSIEVRDPYPFALLQKDGAGNRYSAPPGLPWRLLDNPEQKQPGASPQPRSAGRCHARRRKHFLATPRSTPTRRCPHSSAARTRPAGRTPSSIRRRPGIRIPRSPLARARHPPGPASRSRHPWPLPNDLLHSHRWNRQMPRHLRRRLLRPHQARHHRPRGVSHHPLLRIGLCPIRRRPRAPDSRQLRICRPS